MPRDWPHSNHNVGYSPSFGSMSVVGIDDIALHFPRLYFAMQDFAEFRGADYGKLSKGLGLEAMAIPDVHEDTATMGANAVSRLIDRNSLDPSSIGRIYLAPNRPWTALSQPLLTLWTCSSSAIQRNSVTTPSGIAM